MKGNWGALWAAVAHDHHHAGLIWSETTRGELRLALQVPLFPVFLSAALHGVYLFLCSQIRYTAIT